MVKQWKKMHHGSSATPATYQSGGAIGVPLEDCPMHEEFPSVPWLVVTCCTIIEEKGLEIMGVYRVPGNNAAISNLTEQVNAAAREGGGPPSTLDDPRWGDVNVVSSLLKSFFRKLPDPIFTLDLYPTFIEASKVGCGGGG